MKKIIAAVCLCATTFAPAAWAQTASEPAANAASSGSSDEIVKMHMQISAANKEYNRKVAAAKKVYNRQKAAAAKVRDEAIAAARSGTGQ
jgi:hypothetical protein